MEIKGYYDINNPFNNKRIFNNTKYIMKDNKIKI